MKTKFLLVLVLLVSISINAQTKQWTLQECVNHAIENNITVKQGENSLLINEENIKAAKGAFLPSASANLGQGLGIGSGFDQVSNQRISNQTTHSFSYTGDEMRHHLAYTEVAKSIDTIVCTESTNGVAKPASTKETSSKRCQSFALPVQPKLSNE